MTDTPQTPTECSNPSRTETANQQAIAAVVQAIHLPGLESDLRQRIAAALAPFLIVRSDTIQGIFDALYASDPATADWFLEQLTGSASPDAGEDRVTISREHWDVLSQAARAQMQIHRAAWERYPDAYHEYDKVMAERIADTLATSGRRRE